jgi:cell wall-associated NlpC family hydrolase
LKPYSHLLGKPFKHGSNDCDGFLRAFYRDVYGIPIRNYARPDGWWDHGLNFYIENAEAEGFKLVESGLPLPGDVCLMAIRSRMPNHSGICVGNNQFVHHFYNCLSVEEMYKGMWKNRTMAIYRHPDVVQDTSQDEVDLMNLLPTRLQARLKSLKDAQSATETSVEELPSDS